MSKSFDLPLLAAQGWFYYTRHLISISDEAVNSGFNERYIQNIAVFLAMNTLASTDRDSFVSAMTGLDWSVIRAGLLTAASRAGDVVTTTDLSTWQSWNVEAARTDVGLLLTNFDPPGTSAPGSSGGAGLTAEELSDVLETVLDKYWWDSVADSSRLGWPADIPLLEVVRGNVEDL